jgi:hypothetical protein
MPCGPEVLRWATLLAAVVRGDHVEDAGVRLEVYGQTIGRGQRTVLPEIAHCVLPLRQAKLVPGEAKVLRAL